MAVIATWNPGVSYTPANDRTALGAVWTPDKTNAYLPKSGVLNTHTDALKVTAGGSNTVTVGYGRALVQRSSPSAGDGAWLVTKTVTDTVAVAAPHATFARIDVVYIKVTSTEFGDGSSAGTIEVVTGTPAASPAVPSIPTATGVLKLAEVTIAASTGAQTFVDSRTYTALGSALPLYTASDVPSGSSATSVGTLMYLTDERRLALMSQLDASTKGVRRITQFDNIAIASAPSYAATGDTLIDSSTGIRWQKEASGWVPARGTVVYANTQTASQTLTTGTATPLQWNGTATVSMITPTNTNSRFTPLWPGTYLVTCQYAPALNATGQRLAGISKNGTALIAKGIPASSTVNHAVDVTQAVVCNGSTDYIEGTGFQSSGGNLGTSTGGGAAVYGAITITYMGRNA